LERLVFLQDSYREKLSDAELRMWVGTMQDGYSLEEFDLAIKELIKHPPRYRDASGEVQTWNKMPMLPEVIETIWRVRERNAAAVQELEWRTQESELKRLDSERAEHPERFLGLGDFPAILKEAQAAAKKVVSIRKERNGSVAALGFPAMREPLTDFEYEDRKEILRQQAERLLQK
jgi:hypothetical protein